MSAPRAGDGTPRPARVDRLLARQSSAARPHLLLAALIGTVTAAATVAQAALLAHVIAAAAMSRASLGELQGTLMALAAVFVVRALLAGSFELSGRLAATRVLNELRRRLAEQLLVVRPGLLAGERTGELAAAAVQGVDGLEAYFAGYLPSLMLAVTVPLAVLVWVTPLDPVVALMFAVTIPVLIVFMILIGVGAQSRTRRRWQALTLLSSHFVDVVRGLETLRAHRRELAQGGIMADVGERYRDETMGTLRLAFLSALVLELCAMLGTGLAAATIGVQLTAGDLGLETGLTVLLLAPELYGPLRAVGQQFHATADGLAAAGQLLALLDSPAPERPAGSTPYGPAASSPERPAGSTPYGPAASNAEAISGTAPDPRRAALTFSHVRFRYPGCAGDVLDDLNLTLPPGAFVAIVGPSGAGKSTLAALALRLVDPGAGAVSCGGVDLRSLSPVAWRARTAWVPQRAKLFADTLAANIALAAPGATEGEIRQAAADAGLGVLVDSLPAGLATRIGDGGRRLSAGESQRVALARAFLADASLVVLDEPTANLDHAVAAQLTEAILRLAHGRTVLMITHDAALAARADRVLELVAGQLSAGRPRSGDVIEVAA